VNGGASGLGLLGRLLPFLLLLFPLLVFDPAWIQAERAHRGLAMLALGLSTLLLLFQGGRLRFPRPLSGPVALWVVLALISCLWATDPLLSLETSLWYLCLLLAIPLGHLVRDHCPQRFRMSLLLGILLVGIYGLAQSLGFSWPYEGTREVLGTLANRNASGEWMALALLTLFALHPRAALFAAPVALLFLLRNGSRGPALALSVCGLFVFLSWKSLFPKLPLRLRPLALALCLPFLLSILPFSLSSRAQGPQPSPGQNTISVRREILASTLRMSQDHLLLGVGAGNFRVRYPDYRSAREIELTTFGHRFQTRVLSAHNDPVQLLAELGLLGILPLALFLLALWKTLQDKKAPPEISSRVLLPLVGFLLLSLTRSPLLNAPTALLPFLSLGLFTKRDTHVWPRQNPRFYGPLLGLAALLLLLLGTSIVLGHSHGAGFVRAQKAHKADLALRQIERAHRFDPIETDWALLLAQVLKTREPNRAADLLDGILARRPGSYRALIERAKLGLTQPLLREGGRAASGRLLQIDSAHPMALLLASEYRFLDGRLKEGLDLLEELADAGAIANKQKQVAALAKRASLAQKIPMMRLVVELGKLGRKLFPADPRFAGSQGLQEKPKKENNK
jgi:O-antigen ligase